MPAMPVPMPVVPPGSRAALTAVAAATVEASPVEPSAIKTAIGAPRAVPAAKATLVRAGSLILRLLVLCRLVLCRLVLCLLVLLLRRSNRLGIALNPAASRPDRGRDTGHRQ